MQPLDDGLKRLLVEYVVQHDDDLNFTKYFWKDCEPLLKDISQYGKFVAVLQMAHEKSKLLQIAEQLSVPLSTVYTWVHLLQMPKLAHYLKAYLTLGQPAMGQRWLTIECSHGYGIPSMPFIQVPTTITSWEEVDAVLKQLEPIELLHPQFDKQYLFGFLIGMIIGDSGKSKQGTAHRHLSLALSKKYHTNLKIGDFTSLCAQSIGLRMHRIEDQRAYNEKPFGFYIWASQSSPLLDWIYNVILGLKDDERTTYNSVYMDWALKSPHEFRVGLIQGLAESDGSVSIASQEVEFWVDPHRELLKKLLELEGLRSFNNRQALTLSKSQAIKSYLVPVFSPYLQTVRYQRLEVMANARRLGREERLPQEIREEITKLHCAGLSIPDIIGKIAETRRILISFEAAQRWGNKMREK